MKIYKEKIDSKLVLLNDYGHGVVIVVGHKCQKCGETLRLTEYLDGQKCCCDCN